LAMMKAAVAIRPTLLPTVAKPSRVANAIHPLKGAASLTRRQRIRFMLLE